MDTNGGSLPHRGFGNYATIPITYPVYIKYFARKLNKRFSEYLHEWTYLQRMHFTGKRRHLFSSCPFAFLFLSLEVYEYTFTRDKTQFRR